jgi:uncharacterized protein
MEKRKYLYNFRIDRFGTWFCEGNPIIDQDLFRMLSRALFEKEGGYFVECEGEVHPVIVDDAPLWVKYVQPRIDPAGELVGVEIELQDGRGEELDPQTLYSADQSSLYCTATPNRLKARFGKGAYYELTRFLKETKGNLEFYFDIAGRKFVVWKA